MTEQLQNKLNKYWKDIAIYLLSGFVSLAWWNIQDYKERIVVVENKIHYLELDKVSKQDLKYELGRVSTQINDMKNDIIYRIEYISKKK